MRLKTVQLKNFKRFDDLTIDLGDNPKKIIALVGPNGCGKSSIFDAFEEKLKDYKNSRGSEPSEYFDKSKYSTKKENQNGQHRYNKHNSIFLTKPDGTDTVDKKSFYIRSAYRFTSKVRVDTIKRAPDIIEDDNRPKSSIALDSRMQENYENMLSKMWSDFESGNITGNKSKQQILDTTNNILSEILKITISSFGNVMDGSGQLFFAKDSSRNFPYENLSSGEKEVVDIITDLIIKIPVFNDTVYCIDEPELHLNTAIQRKLLLEIAQLIPDTCQLWVATHSIGFLRALQDELRDECSILDFSQKDYFDTTATIVPIQPNRKNWQRIFQTALEDLTGLLAPTRIIFCEGKLQNALDEELFNAIFGEEFHDTLFVSSGNKDAVKKYATLALSVLNKAFPDVKIIALTDRDDDLDQSNKSVNTISRQLSRREIENYLYDKSLLEKYCKDGNLSFDESEYDNLIKDIVNNDVKNIERQLFQKCCGTQLTRQVKEKLAGLLTRDMELYKDLKKDIFGRS